MQAPWSGRRASSTVARGDEATMNSLHRREDVPGREGHSQARVRYARCRKVEVVRKKPKEHGWTANTPVAENTPR